MADPLGVDCNADQWKLVASNVTQGVVWTLSGAPKRYYVTYRDTGNSPPTDLDDAIPFDTIDEEGSLPSMPISAAAGIDVYIWAAGAAGRVRVDL